MIVNSDQLKGKVAIVTGAGRGLGAEIARQLGLAGARVAVNDLNPDRAEKVVESIKQAGGEAVAITADIGNKFQCVHLVETTRDMFGGVDVLINNASIEPKSTLLKLDEWDWDRCIEVNLKGTFMMSQLVGRVMQMEQKGGAIVNITSTAGTDTPLPDRAAYCASQAGIVGFGRECAREYAEYDIRVNTLIRHADSDPSSNAQIAHAAVFLATAPLVGTTITIDDLQ